MMTMMQQNLLSSVIERIIRVGFLPRLAAAAADSFSRKSLNEASKKSNANKKSG